MNKSTIKALLFSFCLGIIVFIITCWTRLGGNMSYYWSAAIGYFGASIWIVSKEKVEFSSTITTVSLLCMILGAIVLPIIVLWGNFAFMQNLPFLTIICVNTVLGLICAKIKAPWSYIISFCINMLIMTFAIPLWVQKYIEPLGKFFY